MVNPVYLPRTGGMSSSSLSQGKGDTNSADGLRNITSSEEGDWGQKAQTFCSVKAIVRVTEQRPVKSNMLWMSWVSGHMPV